MFLPAIILGGIALVAAVGLGVAARVFYVKEDPRIAGVLSILPGANCGGCGYAGCSACAEAIVAGEAEANACVVGQTETANAVAAYLGLPSVGTEPKISNHECQGGTRATRKFDYSGFDDCRAAARFFGGQIECPNGCLGLGTCMRACKFGAITMGPVGLPVFDPDRCVGCGTCARVCPKGIISIISETTKILHWNQYDECLAPCRQRCPAQINIPKYIQHIKHGQYAEALATIKERNPMPLSIGRVCPEPCATKCRRQLNDEPVAINYLKRFVADWEMTQPERLPIPCAPDTGHRVAIVGGGPAGLSAAFYLRRLGHSVTILERMPELGGMLRYGIPEYRLPKRVLDWEIEGILSLGVEVRHGVEFGRDVTADYLRADGFEAVFLGVGAWGERKLGIEGSDLKGVESGIGWLQRFAKGEDVPMGRDVIVVGGGNTAIDVARSALRLGARTVTMVYRRSRNEMPANPPEIVAAEEEGVQFRFLSAPNRVIGEDGKVTGLEVLRMELGEPDPSGRRRPVPVEGSEEILPCEMIVEAVGQMPDLDFLDHPGIPHLPRTRWQTIEASEDTLQTDVPYVFTGGDCFTGPGLVVEALAAGRFAARSIHYWLTEGEIPAIENRQTEMITDSLLESITGVEKTHKVHEEELPLEERMGNFIEVEHTITAEQARAESERCLNCGTFCYGHHEELARVREQKLIELAERK